MQVADVSQSSSVQQLQEMPAEEHLPTQGETQVVESHLSESQLPAAPPKVQTTWEQAANEEGVIKKLTW